MSPATTAAARRPAAAAAAASAFPAGGPASSPAPPKGRSRGARGGDPVATAALALVTVVAALGLGRTFRDASFVAPVLVAALVGHGVAWACRRRGAGPVASVAVPMAAVALATVWTLVPETTAYGLPWKATWEAVSAGLSGASDEFATAVAPALVSESLLLAAMLGVGAIAVLADGIALRMGATLEALAPSFTLFVLTAVLGADRWRFLATGAYAAAALAFVLVRSAGLTASSAPWFASRRRGGPSVALKAGAVLSLGALAVALVVGPRLPGADAPPVLDWRDAGTGSGRRVTPSPLVSMQARLVNRTGAEVFSVATNDARRSYWRLTSLDTFDGRLWSSNAQYEQAEGPLGGDEAASLGGVVVTQDFSIGALSSIWLPVAYRPAAIAPGAGEVRYNFDSGSLITKAATTDGLEYRVTSTVPELTPERLRQVATNNNVDSRYLALPGRFPAEVRREALEVTGAEPTPYDKALALQRYFRSAPFRYDLQATPGIGNDALMNFVFTSHAGYCEQFAGAYAAMARAVGLPARVAVGFTPGELDPADGRYHVYDRNAHAWPEIWFDGLGWVAFEPTPGRGAPYAQDYTTVPESQADPVDITQATTPTTAPTASLPSQLTPGGILPDESELPEGVATGSEPQGASGGAPVGTVLLGILGAAAAGAAGLFGARRWRHWRRRRRARETTAAVAVAWAEAVEALGLAGVVARPSDTPRQFARAVAAGGHALGPEAAAALERLADDATAARYSGAELPPAAARRAREAAEAVAADLRRRASRPERVRRALDPRPLVGAAPRRRA